MQRLQQALLPIIVLAAAGCSGPAGQDATPDDGTGGLLPADPALPEGFEGSGTVIASAYSVTDYCAGQHQCSVYEFDVDEAWDGVANVTVEAVVQWLLPTSVIELILYRGDTEIAADYDNSPDLTGSITRDLAPGHYRLIVDAYAVAYDEFELRVGFRRAEI